MFGFASKWIFSGRDESLGEGAIWVEEGRICRVDGSLHETQAFDGPRVELDGFSIVPGLIDAHSHVGLVGQPLGSPGILAVISAEIFANAAAALDEGFTTLRDLAGVDGGLCAAIELGLVRGPRILPSGPLIGQTGGHGDWQPRYTGSTAGPMLRGLVQGSVVIDGADEALRAGRHAFRDGATQLKAAVSGGFSSELDDVDDVQLTEEELRALVGVAARRGTYVTVHAHSAEAVRMAVRAGVGCIEHGTFADAEAVRLMASAGVAMVATLSAVKRYESPEVRHRMDTRKAARATEAYSASCWTLKECKAAGIAVGSGTDLVGPGQSGRGREIVVRAGVTSPAEALYAATSVNAAILRLEGVTGSLSPRLSADLLLVDGNPLDEPRLLQDGSAIRLVMLKGRVVKDTLPAELSEVIRLGLGPSAYTW